MQAAILDKLRVLHLDWKAVRRRLCSTLGGAWIQETSKPGPHSDTLPPTRPHLLIVPLPGPSIHKPSQHAIQVNKRPREFSIYGTKALADFPRNLKQNEIMYRS